MENVKSRGEDVRTTYFCEHVWEYVENDVATYVEKYFITEQVTSHKSNL